MQAHRPEFEKKHGMKLLGAPKLRLDGV